jgi:hypothetical protein
MAQYVADHREQFKGVPDYYWIKTAQAKSLRPAGEPDFVELDRALGNAARDPDAVLVLFPPRLTRNGSPKLYADLLAKHLDSPDPLVQFVVHRALGELLCWQKRDPAALAHFDAAIAAMEAAYRRCGRVHRGSLNGIYQLRIEACEFLGRPKDAKETAWAGVKHFMDVGRSPDGEGWEINRLFQHWVTETVAPGQEQQALAVCEAYAGWAKENPERFDGWVRISAKREELRAKVSGNPVPDMRSLRFIGGTNAQNDSPRLRSIRMAATEGKVWFVPAEYSSGPAMVWRQGNSEAEPVRDVGYGATCVTATKDAVFFVRGRELFKLGIEGKLLKRYGGDDPSFPGYSVLDLCEGDGNIYFAFQGSPLKGVAMFDPATEKVTILAPSRRDVTYRHEPVSGGRARLRWDEVTPRLYVCGYFGYNNNPPMLVREYGWSPQDKRWRSYPIAGAPRLIVSYGDETLLVRTIGQQTEFQFLRAGQKLTATVPVPSLLGEPAWDEKRIWVPTSSGLYEVDRATARVRWVAYDDGNPFLSLLRHGSRLYVATAGGLYCGEISSAGLIQQPPQSRPVRSPMAGRRAAVAVERQEASWPASATLSLQLSLENNADGTISIMADRRHKLKDARPGSVQIDVSQLKNGAHLFYFECPGYASQWIRVAVVDGRTLSAPRAVKLFRNRYVVLRCALNLSGGRKLVGNDVEEQHLALTHWTGPQYFREDWMIWQAGNGGVLFGDTLYLKFHRFSRDFGFVKAPAGATYAKMTEAPVSGYRCQEMKAEKGLLLYCRVSGGGKEGFGYGKILVEDLTETPPKDIRVVEQP